MPIIDPTQQHLNAAKLAFAIECVPVAMVTVRHVPLCTCTAKQTDFSFLSASSQHTAVSILQGSKVTGHRMPLKAIQGHLLLKKGLLSWATDAFFQNWQFEVDTLQNSHLLLLMLAYHREQQSLLTFCLQLSPWTAVLSHMHAHTGVLSSRKNMPTKGKKH